MLRIVKAKRDILESNSGIEVLLVTVLTFKEIPPLLSNLRGSFIKKLTLSSEVKVKDVL